MRHWSMKSRSRTTKSAARVSAIDIMLHAVARACEAPSHFRIARPPNLRKVAFRGFPFAIIYRENAGEVQVLAPSSPAIDCKRISVLFVSVVVGPALDIMRVADAPPITTSGLEWPELLSA